MKNYAWIGIFGALLVIVLVAAFVLPNLRPYAFHGTLIESQKAAPDFTLTDQNGHSTSLSDFRGRVVVMNFGYTFCPDVCPATLAEVNRALDQLGEAASQVQVIMVTVDPERDTPQVLSEYLAHFNPDFIGLTGSLEQTTQAASAYGVYSEKSAGSDTSSYMMDHTSSLFVIDQQGYIKLIYPFGTPAKDIASDLEQVLK
jgi:protein SCO1/2